jgi:hypothetical protein
MRVGSRQEGSSTMWGHEASMSSTEGMRPQVHRLAAYTMPAVLPLNCAASLLCCLVMYRKPLYLHAVAFAPQARI